MAGRNVHVPDGESHIPATPAAVQARAKTYCTRLRDEKKSEKAQVQASAAMAPSTKQRCGPPAALAAEAEGTKADVPNMRNAHP